jgi:hypothetical protein
MSSAAWADVASREKGTQDLLDNFGAELKAK